MEELEDSGRMGQRRLHPFSRPTTTNYKSKSSFVAGGGGDCNEILTTESESYILGSDRTCSGHTCVDTSAARTVASEESALHGSDRTYSGHTCLSGSDRASSEHTAKTLQVSNRNLNQAERRGRNPNYPSRDSGSSNGSKYWTPENSTEFKQLGSITDHSPTCVMQVPQPASSKNTSQNRKGAANSESTSPRKRWPVRSDAAHPNPPFLVFLEGGWRGLMAGRNPDSGTDGDTTNPSSAQSYSESEDNETYTTERSHGSGLAPGSAAASQGTGMRTFSSDVARVPAFSDDDDDEDYLETYPSSMDRRLYAATQAMDRMLGPDTDSDTEGNKPKAVAIGGCRNSDIPAPPPPTREIIVPTASCWNNTNNNEAQPAAADTVVDDGTGKGESVLSESSETIQSGSGSVTQPPNRGHDEENIDALLFPPNLGEEARENNKSNDDNERDTTQLSLVSDGIKQSLSMLAASTYARIFGQADDEINSNDDGSISSKSNNNAKDNSGSNINNNSRIRIQSEIPHGNEISNNSTAERSHAVAAAGSSSGDASEKGQGCEMVTVSHKCFGISLLLLTVFILMLVLAPLYGRQR